jgi:hypothetical protein
MALEAYGLTMRYDQIKLTTNYIVCHTIYYFCQWKLKSTEKFNGSFPHTCMDCIWRPHFAANAFPNFSYTTTQWKGWAWIWPKGRRLVAVVGVAHSSANTCRPVGHVCVSKKGNWEIGASISISISDRWKIG